MLSPKRGQKTLKSSLPHVSHQCSFLQEFFSAHGTRMWYTTMNASMVDQLKFTRKCGATVRTNERIERTVETWMHNQMIFLCKTFAAFVTDVWPLTSMEFAVCHQMAFQWERTTALLANEWSLAAEIRMKSLNRLVQQRRRRRLPIQYTYLWTRECVNKWCLSVKLFLHSLHWYGRSVECNNKCVFKQCLWANDLPQCTHTCGRSPVWTRAWVVRWCFSRKLLPHSSQAYGRSFGAPPVAKSCSSAVKISSFGLISSTGSNLQCVDDVACESSASSKPWITFCTWTEIPSRIKKSGNKNGLNRTLAKTCYAAARVPVCSLLFVVVDVGVLVVVFCCCAAAAARFNKISLHSSGVSWSVPIGLINADDGAFFEVDVKTVCVLFASRIPLAIDWDWSDWSNRSDDEISFAWFNWFGLIGFVYCFFFV